MNLLLFRSKAQHTAPPGGMSVRQIADIVFQKAKAGLRAEASRGYLGMLWWVIEPIMYMTVFYIAFAHLYHRGNADYVLFLLIGLITWKWFQSTVNTGANSLIANIGVMNQVYISKIVFPLTYVAINTFKFLIVLLLFITFTQFRAIDVSMVWGYLPLLVFVQLILIIAVTCFLAAIMPFFPDLRFILDNILILIFFLSGIFFNIKNLPQHLQKYLQLNPMADLIIMYRNLITQGIPPDWQQVYIITLSSIALLLLSILLLNRFDRIYPKIIH